MLEKVPTVLKDLMVFLDKRGVKSYIVGGAVRDLVAGQVPMDWDLSTPATPELLTTLFEGTYKVIPLGIKHGTISVFHEPSKFSCQITTFRKDVSCDGRHAEVEFTSDLETDLARRDFTINAMALDLNGNLIDPFGGQADLKQRSLRAVGDPEERLREDRLRMLRACRFAAYGTGMIISQDLFRAIKENAWDIDGLSAERIQGELVKAMKYPLPSKAFNAMRNTGLLPFIIPELQQCHGVEQNKYHKDDVYTHILKVVDAVSPKRTILRFAALFHDIGKPDTKRVVRGYASFHKHEVVGANKADAIMTRLKFPGDWTAQVVLLVRHHMWRFAEDTKDSTIKRWAVTVAPHTRDLLRLRMADRKGNRAKEGKPAITWPMKCLLRKLIQFEKTSVPMTVKDLAISGEDLVKMGFKPGPKFKKILSDCLGLALEDPKNNQIDYFRGFIRGRYKKT